MLHDRARSIMPEKSFRAIDGAAMTQVLAVNTIGPALIAKHFLPLLPRARRAVFAALSARVGSIGDNRQGGWHAYRASKAALNMLIANFGIELARTHADAVVAALHPGTVDTGLSLPFQRGVAPDRLFTGAVSAAHLLAVIDRLTPADSGGLFAWDGTRVVW
jgi:NAD(P)-dependent dehydrogenase (short-subunit alcohol dehydrogenase family)